MRPYMEHPPVPSPLGSDAVRKKAVSAIAIMWHAATTNNSSNLTHRPTGNTCLGQCCKSAYSYNIAPLLTSIYFCTTLGSHPHRGPGQGRQTLSPGGETCWWWCRGAAQPMSAAAKGCVVVVGRVLRGQVSRIFFASSWISSIQLDAFHPAGCTPAGHPASSTYGMYWG